jgi:hypothetical protein
VVFVAYYSCKQVARSEGGLFTKCLEGEFSEVHLQDIA